MAGKVWVVCKMPSGLHLDMPVTPSDGQNQTGERNMETRVTLKGQNARFLETGFAPPHDQEPGVTEVDKDFWDAWSKAYKDFAPLKNGLIFAMDKDPANDKGAKADVKDMADEKNGFEPVPQDAPAPGVEEVKR